VDCRKRFLTKVGELIDVPLRELPLDDHRLLKQETVRRERSLVVRRERGVQDEGEWPFEIDREAARDQLIECGGRESKYVDRVEWVSHNLDNPLATPSSAPCNASWSMLVWATVNRKDFYAQLGRTMGKQDGEGEEEKEIRADFGRFEKLIDGFTGFRRLDELIQQEHMEIYEAVRGPVGESS
jgi:hypothetical protein